MGPVRRSVVGLLVLSGCAIFPLARADDTTPARIVVYTGYGTPERVVVRGRVIADPLIAASPDTGVIENVAGNLDVLESDEVKFAALDIRIGERVLSVRTDEDGLFEVPLLLTPVPLPPGRHPILVTLADKPGFSAPPARGEVIIVPTSPGVALLSDFDDTVVNSHVKNKARLLWGTLTKNASQLEAVPGAADAYRKAQDAGARAFFYLSGSPLQLYDRIHDYLSLHRFPAGVILLKNLGDDPLFAQLDYKVGRLEKLLVAFPDLRFVLVGDSGEKDPEIYRAVKAKHPAQVAAIVIRRAPGSEGDPASRFEGMTVIDDYEGQTDLLSRLVREAGAPAAPPARP